MSAASVAVVVPSDECSRRKGRHGVVCRWNCDPCLSALSVPPWPKRRYINTLPFLFPFLSSAHVHHPQFSHSKIIRVIMKLIFLQLLNLCMQLSCLCCAFWSWSMLVICRDVIVGLNLRESWKEADVVQNQVWFSCTDHVTVEFVKCILIKYCVPR